MLVHVSLRQGFQVAGIVDGASIVHILSTFGTIPASEMTHIVSGGALNSTHSLTLWYYNQQHFGLKY